MKRIAVIAAHPDDEVLGCGGTIAKHAQEGDEVHVLIMAEGITSRSSHNRDEIDTLRHAARQANDTLGAKTLTFKNFPDNRMDTVPLIEIVKEIEEYIAEIQPSIVYTHHFADLNVDHQRVNQAVMTACRPLPESKINTLLFFEVLSSTEWQVPHTSSLFLPTWYNDVGPYINTKLEALQIYGSEMRSFPHSRSLEAVQALATYRGATIGKTAAEAFMLGRFVQT